MPYIQHKFGRTFFQAKGRLSSGVPLVVLHGGPGGSYSKSKSPFLKLSTHRKVFLHDQIGGGKSSPLKTSQMKIETFVYELDHLIKSWGLKEFHLYGGSWGTTLALEYYLRKKPKGLRSLILQSPMFSAKDWERDAIRLIQKLPAKTRKVIEYCHEIGATDSKVYQEAVMVYYLRHVLRNERKLKKAFSGKSNPHGKQVYEYMWGPSEFKPTGTLKKYSRVSDLSKISVPTYLMCGQYDEATPATVKSYHQRVAGSKFKIFKDCSHAIGSENEKLFLSEIKGFLKECDQKC
ncbi:MAG: proline iminopeptidase-family hydrolase [Bacteriovoracaceae bacterium]|jgi:proline iminopeptidase|nr:proline iminopeptidase-family hydrolase [Bacteriovoracaceae bacterium]